MLKQIHVYVYCDYKKSDRGKSRFMRKCAYFSVLVVVVAIIITAFHSTLFLFQSYISDGLVLRSYGLSYKCSISKLKLQEEEKLQKKSKKQQQKCDHVVRCNI